MSTNGKRPRYEEDSDETEASTPSSNGSLRQPQSNSQGLPSRLEPTIFGIFPTSDFTKQVGDFLYQNIDREYVEIEAKLGRLIDTRTKERIQLDVACETIVSPQRRNLKFESNMTEAQHKHFNEILNSRVVATKPPYQIVNGGIVEKVRIAVLNVHSPNTYLDYRITVNSEKPDLSHELELEFINPQILIEEKNKLTQQQRNRYVNIVENFINNIRCLAKEAQIP
ncbi:6820_t:CDS:2 [Diversispora eburnea]|uniref:mRNA-capping enzyme subunit beta n=1 Tax=Diversispora eburnea TaxID=1213867 RepID=A0A9N9EXK6_9GLOM|nr:6820_t:CDS:2 [Diversispora eburnea]